MLKTARSVWADAEALVAEDLQSFLLETEALGRHALAIAGQGDPYAPAAREEARQMADNLQAAALRLRHALSARRTFHA
jgi:hypothetical protein